MHASYQDQRFPARHFRLQAGSSQFSGSVPSQDEDGQSDISGSTYDDYGRNRGKPTLGELLKQVGDTRATGSSPEHRPTEMLPAFVDTKSVPFVLSFTNLTYSVKIRSGMSFRFGREDSASPPTETSKTILDRISGEARDGEILAVLGPSGSGKSTLIDALANRIARDSLKGSVTLNGESVDGRLLKAISAYVMQDDLLFPMLTVEETLNFAAEFRLPRTLSRSKKRSRVETLIDQLGLRHAAKTIIGDEGHRGVSGGERRRVSIGIDIVHDPLVLFLDEPTSGLDSTSAFMVVKVLQRIARTGSIVMMSIHQPSSRVVNLLDRMIILSTGNTVYTGRPSSLPQFFSEFGHPVPENENYTEFALDLIRELETAPVSAVGGTSINQLIDFHRRWRELTFIPVATPERMISLKEAISASISRGKLVSGTAPEGASGAIIPTAPSSSSKKMPTYANPPWTETAILTRRSILNSRRMPELFLMRLGAVTVTGFILATVFWHLDGSPRGVRERVGFFSYAMSTAFYTCSEALPGFLMERYVFMRETAHNAYRRSSYVLSNSLASLPALILFAASFAAITFFAVGLAGSGSGFFYYLLVTFGSFWSGSGFVTFLAGVLPHEMLGYTVIISCIAYFVLFAGMFITRARIPGYWVWFHYLSLVKYPFEGVMENEFGSAGRCFVNGEQVFEVMPVTKRLGKEAREGMLKALSGLVGVNITSETCVTTGSDILKTQSITQLGKWGNLWVTLAWGTLFRILFYIALAYGSKNKRK